MNTIEILAPAGSMESLKAGILAGADAFYVGGSRFGARAYAKNFEEEELLEAIDLAHLYRKKIYLTINTLLKDEEVESLGEYLKPYYLRGIDAVIVQDIGVLDYIQKRFKGLEIHASTQMNICHAKGGNFLKRIGVSRVVPARELSLKEISCLKEETGLEVECFVHGSMCYAYSGQCLFSSLIGGRSGNRGQCAQPCRLSYQFGETKDVDLMSLKDLCTIDQIPSLIESGIDSFKIEGRMKSPDYVYTVTSLYKKYVDFYFRTGREAYKVSKEDKKILFEAYQRRGYTEGYYRQKNHRSMISLHRPNFQARKEETAEEYRLFELPLQGRLCLRKGEKARLELRFEETRVFVEGELVEGAKKQPLDVEKVKKQIEKTGNTGFFFKNLQVEMEDAIFLPIQQLNHLRREGISQMRSVILSKFQREERELVEIPRERKQEKERKGIEEFGGLVQNKEQLEALAFRKWMKTIYLEGEDFLTLSKPEIEEIKSTSKKIILALPYIFRKDTIELWEKRWEDFEDFDGVLVRNYDELGWLEEKGYQKEIRLDYLLYVWNQEAKNFYLKKGISRFLAPVEFRETELRSLVISDSTMIGYGYQPVMITANCVQKSMSKCDSVLGFIELIDRKGNKISVKKSCHSCYNVIYNPSVLFLGDRRKLLEGLSPRELRLDFSKESRQETDEVLDFYETGIIHGEEVVFSKKDFTRGHLKRGVR